MYFFFLACFELFGGRLFAGVVHVHLVSCGRFRLNVQLLNEHVCGVRWIWNADMIYGCWPEITLDHTEKRVVLQFRSLFPGNIRKWCRTLSSTQNAETHWCDYFLWCSGDSPCSVVFFLLPWNPRYWQSATSQTLSENNTESDARTDLWQEWWSPPFNVHLCFVFFFCSLKKVSKERPTYTELMVSVSVLTFSLC